MVYSAAVFNNCGNYKSFGDTKFVPQISEARFETIIKTCKAYAGYAEQMDNIWAHIKREVYIEEEPFKAIGFPDKGGMSSYFSSNITSEDAKFIDEFCQQEKLSPLNTRAIKTNDGKNFEILVASSHSLPTKTYSFRDV
jgi:dipeptidyl-peptidase-3